MSTTTPFTPAAPPGARNTGATPWYRHRWPWLLMLGPGIVVAAGLYMGWIAMTNQDALVVGDYYKQGQAINQDLRRDRLATALELDATLGYNAEAGRLTGHITGAGKPLAGGLLLHLAHATLPGKDIQLAVQSDADGNFSVPLPTFERTRWQVQIENAQREWKLEGSWSWPAQPALEVHADRRLQPL